MSVPETAFRPWALDIDAPADRAFDIADALGMLSDTEALGVSIFEPDPNAAYSAQTGDMRVQALYASEAEAKTVCAALDLHAAQIHQLPATDWVTETQSGLPPVRAGRFYLYGSHDADTVPDEGVSILVEAGMAFGTGHHGTTAGCLLIYDTLLQDGFVPDRVLDLGCGAGVLAIAAAKTLPAQSTVLATDIDPDAVDVTRAAATVNHADRIEAFVADGFASDQLSDQQFDLIFANILAGPLIGLADDISAALTEGGRVILSGILDEKADIVTARFVQAGLDVRPFPSLEGWTSLLGIKKPPR